MTDGMFPKRIDRPGMVCAVSPLMAEETDGRFKVIVKLILRGSCLDVPGTWALVVGKPGLLVMFESSVFRGWSGCTPLE